MRLVWPQWQGAGTSSVRSLAAEFPFDVARRGYAVGSAVLEAVLPPHAGPRQRCRSRVAIHFDVDTIDSDEIVLGVGVEPGGLTSAQVRRIVADARAAAHVLGFTVAEYFPRQVMHMRQILEGLPLIGDPATK